jgi:hypothetical protein
VAPDPAVGASLLSASPLHISFNRPLTPLRLVDAAILSSYQSELSLPCSIPARALYIDTGGGMEAIGQSLVTEFNRAHPGCIEVYHSPRNHTSPTPIGGLGATNVVSSYAKLHIAIAGSPLLLSDIPIVAGFYGLVLGNTFNRTVRAEYSYSSADDATFSFDHPTGGRILTRAAYLRDLPPPQSSTLTSTLLSTVLKVEPLLFLSEAVRMGPSHSAVFTARAPAGYSPGDTLVVEQLTADPRWKKKPGRFFHN